MVFFPNSKINIGLNVLYKRNDGYHELESLFYPIPLHDALEILPDERFQFHSLGAAIPGDATTNLCVKAYDLLKASFPDLPAVNIALLKSIPVGAGMGGGSSDGAHTLKLLNRLFALDLDTAALSRFALMLGSDCPFFIENKSCVARGRGEKLQFLDLDLSAYRLVLVHPGIHINTGWAFGQIKPQTGRPSLTELVAQPIHSWKQQIKNDFEYPVFSSYPVLQKIKEDLYAAGAIYASMTGSGSSFYGIFESGFSPEFHFDPLYRVYILN